MRLTIALAACLTAPLASATAACHHVPETAGPACFSADEALARVRANGVAAVRLDGDDAVAMLDAINRTGEPSHYAASTLVMLLLPDRVVVGMFHACHEGDVTLSPEGFRQAYGRMRDGRV